MLYPRICILMVRRLEYCLKNGFVERYLPSVNDLCFNYSYECMVSGQQLGNKRFELFVAVEVFKCIKRLVIRCLATSEHLTAIICVQIGCQVVV